MTTISAPQTVLDAAIEAGRIPTAPKLAPELVSARRRILLAIETHARRAHETIGSLPFGRIHGVFLYAVCRGYEAAYYWHTGDDYEISTAGMFTGEVQCNVSDEMIAHIREIPLADELFEAFTKWAADNAGTFTNGADPFEPMMDALAAVYDVAYAIGITFLPPQPIAGDNAGPTAPGD